MMLDEHHRMPLIDQALEHGQQNSDILQMQASGGLIEQEQGRLESAHRCRPWARLATANWLWHLHHGRRWSGCQVTDELEPLALTARQGVEGLAQPEVTQPHLGQQRQLGRRAGFESGKTPRNRTASSTVASRMSEIESAESPETSAGATFTAATRA